MGDLSTSLSLLLPHTTLGLDSELKAPGHAGTAAGLLSLLLPAHASMAAALQSPKDSQPSRACWQTAGCLGTVLWSPVLDKPRQLLQSKAERGDSAARHSMATLLQASLQLFQHVPLIPAADDSSRSQSCLEVAASFACHLGIVVEMCSTPSQMATTDSSITALLGVLPKMLCLLRAAALGGTASHCISAGRAAFALRKVTAAVVQHARDINSADKDVALAQAASFVSQWAQAGSAMLAALPPLAAAAGWLQAATAAEHKAVAARLPGALPEQSASELCIDARHLAAACFVSACSVQETAGAPADTLAAAQAALFDFHTKACRLLNSQGMPFMLPSPAWLPILIGCLLSAACHLDALASPTAPALLGR